MNNMIKVWHTFAAAPHRVMFLAGAVQGVATMIWWLIVLSGRLGWLAHQPVWPIAPVWAHAFLMIYGFFPFFIFGFLFTTYPNWLNGEKIAYRYYVASFLLMAAGIVLFYAGLLLGATLLLLAVLLLLAGWGLALYALVQVQVLAVHPDKRHSMVTSAALAAGWLGMAGYLYWLITGQLWALEFARIGGIWFFLLPVFITVSHRMLPFFSSKVLPHYTIVRPYWALWLMLVCVSGHGILQLEGSIRYLWLFDLPLAMTALVFSYHWQLWRSFQVRLLAVLHVAFLWLGLSLMLFAVQSFVYFYNEGTYLIWGLAPLHALVIGFFSSMMLGMVTRVTLGHSGMALVADNATCVLFWGMQLVALVRIVPELLPVHGGIANGLIVLAALLWLLSMLPWVMKYLPKYWQQRRDGKTG